MSTNIGRMKAPENAFTMQTKASEVKNPKGARELGELVGFVKNLYCSEWSGRYYVVVDPVNCNVAVEVDFYGVLDAVLQWSECVVWVGLNPHTYDIIVSGYKLHNE